MWSETWTTPAGELDRRVISSATRSALESESESESEPEEVEAGRREEKRMRDLVWRKQFGGSSSPRIRVFALSDFCWFQICSQFVPVSILVRSHLVAVDLAPIVFLPTYH